MLAILGLGGQEIFVIFLIVLLLFGATKLPELARGLGKSLGEFKKAKKELEEEITQVQRELDDTDKEPRQTAQSTPKQVVDPYRDSDYRGPNDDQ